MKKTLSITLSVLMIAAMIFAMPTLRAQAAETCQHEYSALCDTTCNICGAIRDSLITHTYSDWLYSGVSNDGATTERRDCILCGYYETRNKTAVTVTRTQSTNSGNTFTGEEFIYATPSLSQSVVKFETVEFSNSDFVILDSTSVTPLTSLVITAEPQTIVGSYVSSIAPVILGLAILGAATFFIIKAKENDEPLTSDEE